MNQAWCKLALPLFLLCLSSPSRADEDARAFKRALLAEIDRSDHIVLVEHSDPVDFGDLGSAPEPREIVHSARALSKMDRNNLRKWTSTLPDATPKRDYVTFCGSTPHHRIEFHRRGKRTSSMEICFECGETTWDGTREKVPPGLQSVASRLVRSMGLQETRPWHQLAMERLRKPPAE